MKLRQSILRFFLSIVLVSAVVSLAGLTPGVSAIVGIGILAVSLVAPSNTSGIYTMTAIDNTELVANLGAYFRKFKNEIVTRTLLGMDISDRIEIMDDVSDELPLPNLEIGDLVKPGNDKDFVPAGGELAFGSRTLKVRDWKVDLLLEPTKLHKTWLGHLKSQGSDPFKMPFEQFIFQYITDKMNENLRLKALFNGVYNAVGTAPEDVWDGFLKIIADEITATNITPAVTGPLISTTIVDQVEATYDTLDEAYKNVPTQMLCAPNIFDMYNRRYRTDYGANNNYDGSKMKRVTLDGTMCDLVKEPGMAGSQRLIVTSKENMVYGIDSMADINNWEIQKFNRTIKIMVDAKGGVQFKQTKGGVVAANDQA